MLSIMQEQLQAKKPFQHYE